MLKTLLLLVLPATVFANIDLAYLDQNFCPHVYENLGNRFRTHKLYYDRTDLGDFFIQSRKVENAYLYHLFTPTAKVEIPSDFGPVRDFKIINESAFILTKKYLVEMSLKGKVYEVHSIPKAQSNSTFARSMALKGDHLYLAQGKLGIQSFNLLTFQFENFYSLNTQRSASAAVSLVSDNENLYVVMTGRSDKGFNGVLVFNPENANTLNEAAYDKRRVGVIFPYASSYLEGDKLYLNNGGWIHEVSINEVMNKNKIRPKWRAIPFMQNNYRQFILLEGDLIFNQSKIMGCGIYRTQNRTQHSKAFAYQ